MRKEHFGVTDTVNGFRDTELSRRSLLKQATLAGLGLFTAGSLLAACADAVDEDVVADPDEDPEDTTLVDDDPVEDPDDAVPDGGATDGGDANVMYWGPTEALSPVFGGTSNTQQFITLMFGTLVKMNDMQEPVPDLAESIDISDDAMEYRFELHDDVYFTDGEHLTSSDVRFTYEINIHPATTPRWGQRLLHVEGAQTFFDGEADSVSGIETPDDFTVILHMEQPFSVFLHTMVFANGIGILPEHILGDVPPDEVEEHEFQWTPTVTAGAFKFHQYVEDQYVELHRNEDYFRGPPAVERIFMREIEYDVGVAQLETGELDLMSLPVDEIERVESIPHVSLVSNPSASVSFITLNLTEERFQDVRVRQAMMCAVDRQGIVDSILDGYGEAVHQTIIGPDWFGTPDGINPYDYDPELARELLEEAGWDFDEPMEILVSNAAEPELRRALTVVQDQWNEAGILAEVNYLESAVLNERTDTEVWDWEAQVIWGGVFRVDPNVSSEYFHSREHRPFGNNYGQYSNDRVDELFDRGREILDQDERIEIYTEIAQILNEEVPWITLYSPDALFGVSERLQGAQPGIYFNNKLWNAHEWTLND